MITNTGDLNDDETKLEQENPNMETQEGQGKNKETRVQNPDNNVLVNFNYELIKHYQVINS